MSGYKRRIIDDELAELLPRRMATLSSQLGFGSAKR